MAIKKVSEITEVNKLGMFYFHVETLNTYDQTMLIISHQGYPDYYRVEFQFLGMEYLACSLDFGPMAAFQFRQATEQEAFFIPKDVLEFPLRSVYCFEEGNPAPGREARKFFFVANRVEITVYYDAGNVHHRLDIEKMHQE